MPLYEYNDPETGVNIELRRTVEDRDKPIVLKRSKTVPDRISIHGLGPTQEQQFNKGILDGWYSVEQRAGSQFDGGGFTKEQIKSIWANE